MNFTELLCHKCNITFTIKTKYYNRKIKGGQTHFYCSKGCFINDKKNHLIKKQCLFCNNIFETNTSKDAKRCCSKECSSKYSQSFVDVNKISKSIKNYWKMVDFKHKIRCCKYCGIQLEPKKYTKCCSIICARKLMSLSGRKSVKLQKENRRSKNEIYFANLCKQKFNDILTNEPIFNGWDADVILPNEKIAVLWNGKWHYEKIKNSHSVNQVQNRDRIRLDEIKKMSYTPYTIKDLGKYNPKFVIDEFEKFILFINNGCVA